MKVIVDLVSGIDISPAPCDGGPMDLTDRPPTRLTRGAGSIWLASSALLLAVICSLTITPPNAMPRPGFPLATPMLVPALAGDPIMGSRVGTERTGQE